VDYSVFQVICLDRPCQDLVGESRRNFSWWVPTVQ